MKGIYEPSLEKEVLEVFRKDKVSMALAGVLPPGVSPLKAVPQFDLGRVNKLMEGAIDMHIHNGPDPYMCRIGDTVDLALAACQAGMEGVCFGEPHHIPSGPIALLAEKVVNQWAEEHGRKKIRCFGGISLNYAVGGLNPAAVIASARIGAKVVWPPGVDSSHYYKMMGVPGGIDVLDENDNVVPAMKEILSIIAEGDLVLNMSCLGVKDVFCLIDEANKLGIKRMNVVHPSQPTSLMTVEQMKIAADKGASIEITCNNFQPEYFSWDVFMQAYNLLGADKIIASSDNGCFEMFTPVVAMRAYITGMLTRGISDSDVEKIVKANPKRLLY